MKSTTVLPNAARRAAGEKRKIGAFFGVFVPGIITMLGSLVYLPYETILSRGFSFFAPIFLLGMVITLITTFSLSSAISNRKMEGGGVYFVLSRSFGIEIGTSIGIFLYIAEAVALVLCVMGAANMLAPMVGIMPETLGIFVMILLFILALLSRDLALRAQFLIFCLLLVGISTLFFSPDTGPSNLSPQPFWTIFALFYPALAGVETGVSFSGDLKDPAPSLIRGSFATVIVAGVIYAILFYFLSHKQGNLFAASPFPLLIKGAAIAASLSSALGAFLSAPRILHAIAKDKIVFPWLTKYSTVEDPRLSLVFTFGLCYAFLLFGSIEVLIPFLAMVFFIVYGMINLAAAIEDFVGAPSWRPTLRTSWKVSIFAVLLILFVMFKVDLEVSLIALVLLMVMTRLLRGRSGRSRFDDLRQSILFSLARRVIYKLSFMPPSMRSWRPNLLILSENASQKSPLVRFSEMLTNRRGFLTLASVIREGSVPIASLDRWTAVIRENLRKNHVEALVEVALAESLAEGFKSLLSNYTLGCIEPNTVLLGECQNPAHFEGYVKLLKIASEAKKNVIIVRGDAGKSRDGDIDVWWDDRRRKNASFSILLTLLLKQNARFYRKNVLVKSFAKSRVAQEEKRQYLAQFIDKARLKAFGVVYEKEALLSEICLLSSGADLVILGLKAPSETEDYAAYFKGVMEGTSSLPHVIFVIANETVDLDNILA
ncbi:MAG: hypothetical protein A3F09_03145 [Chlamydiae bacterium RIFCSPHIGHO2_12_FULL_49_11]|nr:MAG: hypothetical protein A3F09_03145 [Chlamydiae bacterium RIFCSPHIGHO2_12_FULL_49_11]